MNNHYKDIISEKYKKILFIHGWGFTRQILKDSFDTACLGQALFIDLYEHMIDTNGDLKTAAKNIHPPRPGAYQAVENPISIWEQFVFGGAQGPIDSD